MEYWVLSIRFLYLVGFTKALTHSQYQSGILQFVQEMLHNHGANRGPRQAFGNYKNDNKENTELPAQTVEIKLPLWGCVFLQRQISASILFSLNHIGLQTLLTAILFIKCFDSRL